MNKTLTILIIFIFSITGVFAYSPTLKDSEVLNKVYPKLDLICEKSEIKCKSLKTQIDNISYKYKKKENLYFILTEISKYINDKLNKNELIKEKTNKIIVTKVSDGDTIHFKKDGKKYITRLIGIDSPENTTTRYGYTEKLGNEAKVYLNDLILNKEITIEYDNTQTKIDKYGRHLVYIFYKGENINQKMIEQGLAKEYTYNKPYKYQKEFLEAEEKAKELKKGIWSLSEENTKKVIKQISEHIQTSNTTCNIKGNISSKGVKIYHYPGCKSYNLTKISLDKGEKYFCSEEEAKIAGWRVAGNCD